MRDCTVFYRGFTSQGDLVYSMAIPFIDESFEALNYEYHRRWEDDYSQTLPYGEWLL